MVDILDREAVLAKRRRSYKILELPSSGTARLQSLTEKERSDYEMAALDKQGRPTKTGLADARRLLIAMMWVDAACFFAQTLATSTGVPATICPSESAA